MGSFKIICLSVVIFFGSLQCANCANILFYFAGGTYSHEIPIWPLAVGLADRNHSVTFVSTYTKKPWKDARIKIVTSQKTEEISARFLADVLEIRLKGQEYQMWKTLPSLSYEICEYFMSMEEAGDKSENNVFWNNGEKFDLVILDAVANDCGHIIGAYHNAKVIVSDSSSALPWFNQVYGFPAESNWLPHMATYYNYPMTIFNMLENYLEPWYWSYVRHTQLYSKLDVLIKRVFRGREKIPSFLEMERKADLIFVNTHVSVELPRSLPPNVIKIGGLQFSAQKDSVIPENLSKFMEEAEQGVILISFGSNVDFAKMPKHLEVAFYEAIKRFPKIHFIAKASVSSTPENVPKNLRFQKWIPQKEILGHPKILAFIAHGGLNGIIEATYSGVPIIAVPIFAEQDFQSYQLQARESGIRLEMRELTVDIVSDAIKTITTDPKYRMNMKKLQATFHDRPEGNPLELAIKWTEFVLKHDDLAFMNPITYQPLTVYIEQLIFSPHCCTIATISVAAAVVIATVFFIKMLRLLKYS